MMKKFALLVVVGLFFAADAAQAGVFRRGSSGGCPGGVCGGSSPVQKYAAAPIPVPPPAIVERSAPTPVEPEVAAPRESAPVIAAPGTEGTQRFARLRGLGRRR